MERQRNMYQMKEQENFPEELDEMEVSNLSYREFNDYKNTQQHKNDQEIIKKDDSEIKNEISEINNTLEGINNRLITW